MLKKLKLFGLAIPAFAGEESISIGVPTGTTWAGLGTITLPKILSGAINLVLIVVSIAFFFYLVIGGLKWITSSGDEKKVAAARSQITNALIGLMIVFATWAILKLIETLFGVSILTGNLSLPFFYKE